MDRQRHQQATRSDIHREQRSSLTGSEGIHRDCVLKITVLSPVTRGQGSLGHDAILGAPGMAALTLGIDKEKQRLYRKPTRTNYRKFAKKQQQQPHCFVALE